MASLYGQNIDTLRAHAEMLHVDVIHDANSLEKQANRHHTTNARLAANRARKAISAALVDMENAVRLLDLARKES